jgi:hemerythrin-like domain-containing protein
MSTPTIDPAAHSPIEDFSQCHAGIIRQLNALEELPALLEPAARARRIAADTLVLFRDAVLEHHVEEERELFPAVLASAAKGEEYDKVLAITKALTTEHREVEAAWSKLEPHLKALSKGQDSDVKGAAISALVDDYRAHARYEEQVFLPMAQAILSRNGNHLAALGMSLHIRHTLPEVMHRFSSRI